MLFTKVITAITLSLPSALSIGVSLTQFSDGNCGTPINPALEIVKDACNNWSTKVGKSMTVNTYAASGELDFSCPDGKNMVLQVWQSSGGCGNIPDATIGPLSTSPQKGGCIIMPARSASFACQ